MKLFKTPYDGYFVSRAGRVYSSKHSTIREIAQFVSQGYMRVEIRITKRGKSKRQKPFVHKLVADAILKKPRGKIEWIAIHKNGKRKDNRAANLRITTRSLK